MKDIFLVDADDTILDFHGASGFALKHCFSVFNEAWDERYLQVFKRMNDGLWAALERKEITRQELIQTRFSIYLKELGKGYDADLFNREYLRYLAENPMYFAGAEAFLTELGARGRIYIVTNGTEWIQKSRFQRSGLNGYAEKVFISDVVGYNKPDLRYTQHVIDNIENFDMARAVWIGDSLSADIAGANAVGMASILYDTTGKKEKEGIKPDYIAKNYKEILEILQKIAVET